MRCLATRGTTDVKSFSYCFFKTFRPVYLWRVENFLKYWKVSKYYIQDCLRTFLLLSTFWIMTQVSKTSSIFSQKRNFYPPVKVVSFLMTFFDLKSNLKKRLLCHVRVSEWIYTYRVTYNVKKLLAWNRRGVWV